MRARNAVLAAGFAVAAMAMAAPAQSGQGQQQRMQQQKMQQQRMQQQRQQQSGGQSGQQPRMVLDREALALVGYDLNQDGQSDVYYWVSQWDLEPIKRDQQRAQRSGGQEPQFRQMSERRYGQAQPPMRQQRRMSQQAQINRYRGTVEDVSSFRFQNGKDHLVAKVGLDDGRTVPVLLGTREELRANINEGSRITFSGDMGRINGRPVIVAKSISDGQYSRRVSQSRPDSAKIVKGTVTDFKQFSPEGSSSTHVLARVRDDQGRTSVLNLGPGDRLSRLDLSRGDELMALAVPGSINGNPVWTAQEIHSEGETVDLGSVRRTLGTQAPLNLQSFRQGRDD